MCLPELNSSTHYRSEIVLRNLLKDKENYHNRQFCVDRYSAISVEPLIKDQDTLSKDNVPKRFRPLRNKMVGSNVSFIQRFLSIYSV